MSDHYYLYDPDALKATLIKEDTRDAEILRLRAENEKLRERLEKAHSFISRADWMQFFQEEQEGDND